MIVKADESKVVERTVPFTVTLPGGSAAESGSLPVRRAEAMAQQHAFHAPSERANFYQQITDRIIAELEGGHAPWVQPWARSMLVSACRAMRSAPAGIAASIFSRSGAPSSHAVSQAISF